MQTQIEQITNAIKDIRNTIAEEGGQISESTVLENYPDAIKSIPKVTHNMQQQIFIFYCYAKNVSEALKKSTPTITWNDDKGYIVSGEDEYNWNRDVELLKKEMSSGEERRLFVRILILRYGDNIENIDWSIPMPIEGIQGPQGKSGRDGKDGIVAGMRQFLAAPIFKIVSKNQVETELKDTIDVEYDHDQIAQYNIPYPEYIKIDGNLINETVTERSNGWGLNFNFENSANQKDYAVLKRIVSYGNLNDMATSVSDPVLLSGDRVIDQTIWYITDSNSSLAPEFSKETWSETVPTNFYNENNTYDYLWMCVETKYSSGSTVYTDPVCILKKPNSIVSTTNLYGVSSNVSSEPSAWLPFNKVPENYDVLWQRTTTNFKWSDSNVECRPIAIKGAPGVSPITVLASVDSSDLESWTLAHTTIDLQSAIIVNKETYVWNGTTDPSNITSNYVSVSDENNTYYWINLGKWAADSFPDWNVNNPESTGYIANRTHYFTRNQQYYTERITSDDRYRFYLYCSRPDNIDNAFNFRVNDVYADWFTIDNTVDDPNWIVAYLNDDPERTVQINRNVNEWFEVECLVRGGNADYTEEYTGKEITLSIKWDVLKKLDPMFVPQMIEITYDELCVLRNESQLIPGMQYRITDYVTTTALAGTSSARNKFDIIVTADSIDKLNENARAIQNKNDSYYFVNNELNKWELKYSLDNNTSKFAWAVYGTRPKITLSSGEEYYISTQTYVDELNLKTYFYLSSGGTMTDYKIPIEYKSIPVKDLNIYIGESTLSRTGFFPSGTIGDTTITINGQASIDGLSESYTATRVEENDLILDGTHFYGYVYHINRIPIYIYVTNSRFDSGVYTRKQLFVLPVNVTSIYDECGKGVIYYMKDEYNNEAPYDFKNILYTRDANTLYTFDNADGTDSSKKGYAWGNVIKPHYVSNKYMLNWIRLWGSYHSNNVFGPNCHNITLNDESCSNNIFGSCCAEITLAGRNECNTFGNNCFDITLGGEDSGMSFGNYCSNISIDITESRKITFLSGCTDIEVTDYVAQNFFQ